MSGPNPGTDPRQAARAPGRRHLSEPGVQGYGPPARETPVDRRPGEAGDEIPFRASTTSAAYDSLSTLPVVLVLDNVRSLYNVGAFFRTADNAGARALVLSGITPRPPHHGLSKTALGAETAVRWEAAANGLEAIRAWRAAGYEIAAIETASHAVDLFDWQPRFPVCVVFGHEVDGIGREVLAACDTCVRVPTLGVKHSLNVATAGGVVCYELLRKYRALAAQSGAAPSKYR